MQIGELFLNLGITGSDKTLDAIGKNNKGLKDTASVSLEAKAAIIGAMYALQRLFSSSNKTGNDLVNFNAEVGESAQTLQRYQYAARQVGVTNDQLAGTFKNLQQAATKQMSGEQAIAGLERVALKTRTDAQTIQKMLLEASKGNVTPLLQKLQEYAQAEENKGLRNQVLSNFGVSGPMTAALSRGAFNQNVLNRAPTISDKELENLDKANAAWANILAKIEMAIAKFNAVHGVDLVNKIEPLVDKVLSLANSFIKLADSLKLFEAIGSALDFAVKLTDSVKEQTDAVNTGKDKKGRTAWEVFKDNSLLLQAFKYMVNEDSAAMKLKPGEAAKPQIPTVIQQMGPMKSLKSDLSGPVDNSQTTSSQQNVTVNQTFNFKGEPQENKKSVGDAMKKGITDAFRSNYAQGRGT